MVETLIKSISSQDLGPHAEANMWRGSAEAAIGGGVADFEQNIVDKAIDQWRRRLIAHAMAKFDACYHLWCRALLEQTLF